MNSPKPIANSGAAAPRAKARLLVQSGIPRAELALAMTGLLTRYALERPAVVLIEGIYTDAALDSLEKSAGDTRFVRLGFGCPCCIGSLPVRVTLTRLLRERFALIVLAVRDIEHEKTLAKQLEEQFHAYATVEIVTADGNGGALLAQTPLN